MLNRSAGFAGLLFMLLSYSVCAQSEQPSPLALTIEEAVQTALSQNPTVQAAREQVNAARAGISSARAGRLPEVEAGAEYRRIISPPSFEIPSLGAGTEVAAAAEENVTGTIAVRQAVYTGGRVGGQISRARALFDSAVAELGAAEAQTALQTREAYYAVLLGQSLVDSAEKSLAAARGQLAAATAKFEVGTAPKFDVLRAETQVSEAEQALVEARNEVEVSRVALNRIIGAPLEQHLSVSDPGMSPYPEEDLSALSEEAGLQRTELLGARAQVAAAEADIRLAGARRLPELSLSADYQTVRLDTPAQTTGWTFMATAAMDIFDGGRIRADIAEARSLKDKALANLEETSRLVEQEVRQAYLNLQTRRQTLDTARARLAQAEEAYDVATVRYEAGVGTAVELADGLAALTAARTNMDRAASNYNIAYARLQRAVGRTLY